MNARVHNTVLWLFHVYVRTSRIRLHRWAWRTAHTQCPKVIHTYKHSHLWTVVNAFPHSFMPDIKHTVLQTTQWYTATCPPPPTHIQYVQSLVWSTPHKNSMVCRVALTWVGPLKGTIRHVDHAHYNKHSNDGIDPPASGSHKEQQLKCERMRSQQHLSLKKSLIQDTAGYNGVSLQDTTRTCPRGP